MRRVIQALAALTLVLVTSLAAFAQDQSYTIAPGDTLYRISLKYNVSLTAMAAANNIRNVNLIYAGQVLKIPAGGTVPTPATPVPGQPTPVPTGGSYTVVRGDTLGRIAARFGTTFQAIAAANSISNPNFIYAGQVLRIPGAGTNPGPIPPAPTANPNPNPNPNPITGFELGGHVFGFSYSDLMRNTGMTWAKVQIRYNQGDDPNGQAGTINDAKSRGFRILLSVVGNKDQLGANPTQFYQDFATYLGGLAAIGADGIEVWNEPNIETEWPQGLISGAQYTQMLSAAYQAIKSRNNATLVISAAPAPTGFFGGCSTNGCDDDRFIAAMSAAGARNFMDCVGIHYNAGMIPPSQTSGAPVGSPGHYSWYYQGMVNLYSSTFSGKPLCFTEIGYVTGEGYGQLPPAFAWANNVTVANQAEWLADAVRRAKASGTVRLFIIWNVDSTTFGTDPQAGYAIIRPNGTCPACNSIAAVMR